MQMKKSEAIFYKDIVSEIITVAYTATSTPKMKMLFPVKERYRRDSEWDLFRSTRGIIIASQRTNIIIAHFKRDEIIINSNLFPPRHLKFIKKCLQPLVSKPIATKNSGEQLVSISSSRYASPDSISWGLF